MTWTMKAAAREWGVDDETLKKRLVAAGHQLDRRGKEFTTREISDALLGSLQREKIRLTAADADLKERKRQERDGVLVHVDKAQQIIADALGPIRSALVALPSGYASRCNPSDPELARSVLAGWVKQVLKGETE